MSAFWKTTLSVPTPGYFTSFRISVDSTPGVGKHAGIAPRHTGTLGTFCRKPLNLFGIQFMITVALQEHHPPFWVSYREREAPWRSNRDGYIQRHPPNPFIYPKHSCHHHPTRQWRPASGGQPAPPQWLFVTHDHLCAWQAPSGLTLWRHTPNLSLMRYSPTEQWFSACGSRLLWESKDPFPGVT